MGSITSLITWAVKAPLRAPQHFVGISRKLYAFSHVEIASFEKYDFVLENILMLSVCKVSIDGCKISWVGSLHAVPCAKCQPRCLSCLVISRLMCVDTVEGGRGVGVNSNTPLA